MKRKLVIGVVLIATVMCYKVITCFLPSEVLNPYFETRKTGYTWLGYEIYEHKRFFSNIDSFKYYFLENNSFFILKFFPHENFNIKKNIKIKSFWISIYDEEYRHSYDDFDLEIYVMKLFDFNITLGDTLKYHNKIYNKILTQKFYDTSIGDTLYYFVSEHPLESENYPFKESYLVSESKGLVATMLVNESTTPIQVRFLRGNWNYNLYKGKKIRIKHTVKKEENYEMETIDIKQIPAFKKECFWQK